MSDLTTTEKAANYSARAGEVIAGNLARGSGGQFTSAGNASAKKPPAQSIGAKRTARANAATIAAAKRAAAKAKPKKGKGGKAKPKSGAKVKPKGTNAAARRAEADKRRAQRAAEQAKKKLQRDIDKTARDQKRAADQAKRKADREAAKVARDADRAKRLALAEQRRAAKGGGGKGAPKPKAKPDKAAEQQTNRAAVQAATLDKPAFDALQELVSGKQPPAGPAVDALLTSGLAERDTAGQLRISQAGRAYTNAADQGDIGRANDAMSRARDRVAERSKPRGVPVKGAVTTKEYQPDRVMSAGHTGVMVYLPLAADVTAALSAIDGVTEPAEGMHITMAYLGNSQEAPLSTNKDRMIGAVAEWAAQQIGDIKGVINGAGRFMTVEDNDTNAVYVSPDLPRLPALRQSLVEWLHSAGFDVASNHGYTPHITVAYIPIDDPTPDIRPADIALTINAVCVAWGDEQYDFPFQPTATKESATSYTIYKQANGRYRWIGVSSTAYQDRDGQYVSLKALQDDVARADQNGHYGPLRYWHMPGVDIGTTDYNAVVGRSLIESGEISDDRVGAALASSSEPWQMSLGFIHGRDQPQGDTFTSIRRFERSILPASAASNPFTSLQVYKGDTMGATPEEKIAKLKELVGDDLLAKLLANVERTEKEADAAGVRYKMQDGGPEVEEKAADGGMAAADEAAGEMEMDAEEAAGEAESILTDVEINAIADAVIAKLTPLLGGMATKEAAQPDLIERFLGAVSEVQKEAQGASAKAEQAAAAAKAEADKRAGEIATLKQKLAELEGDQPAGAGFRASQADATVTQKQHKGPMDADAFMAAADFLLK